MSESESFERELADPHCISPEQARALLDGHGWGRFAVLGDSVAEGVGDPSPGYRNLSWTDRVAGALREAGCPDLDYRNFGRTDALAEEVRETQLAPALEFGPKLALVSCGGNNALRRSWDPDGVSREIGAILGALRGAGVDVITTGLFDITRTTLLPEAIREGLRARLHELAAVSAKLAIEHDTIHVDFLNHPAGEDHDLYSADLRHGTRRAHAICASEVIRALGGRLRDGAGRS